jgi:hypothetical protein
MGIQSVPVRVALVLVLSLSLLCSGCTTLQRVPLPERVAQESLTAVKPGDRIVVFLKSGEQKRFRIAGITETGLEGRNDSVAFADIASLDVRKVHAWRTTGAVVGTVVGIAVIGFAILVSAILSGEEE